MRTQSEKENTLLKALEPLLVAAFSSPHKQIVNETILFWNESFGCQDTIDYPTKLLPILRARSDEADIILPGLPDDQQNASVQLPVFYESPLRPHESEIAAKQPDLAEMSWLPSTAPVMHISNPNTLRPNRPASSPVAAVAHSAAKSPPKTRLRHDNSQIQFVSIESSPINNQDSQMLTEHQKEVQARQHEENRIFADLSSSPIVKSQTGGKGIVKRLDFGSGRIGTDDNDHAGTPQALPDMDVPMSDDIPSSPTPSSTKDIEPVQIEIDDEVNDMDIPSSPPRRTDEDEPFSVTYLRDAEMGFEDVKLESDDCDRTTDSQVLSSEADEGDGNSQPADFDLPSDTILPSQQLQLEEEAAAVAHDQGSVRDDHGSTDLSLAKPATHAKAVQEGADKDDNQSRDTSKERGDDEVMRMEDPLADLAPKDDEHIQQSSGGQHSQGGRRKRKRCYSTARTTSKRKTQSPLKGFFSFWRPNQQEVEGEDIGEEIVVASSQISSSPASPGGRENVRTSIPAANSSQVAQETITAAVEEEQQPATAPLPKRSRGRPKKLATPTLAQSHEPHSSARSLKRKAVAMKAGEVEPATSFVEDTPAAPPKTRKRREGQDVKSAALEEETTGQKRSTRRSLSGVVLPKPSGSLEEESPAADPSMSDVQLAGEEQETVVSQHARPIATPRSILGRLRGILPDLRKMILGSQEEREIDDVLFEIRKEVHEAGRRGRD